MVFTICFQLNRFGGRKVLAAIKEGRYVAKQGVYNIEQRTLKDDPVGQTNKSAKKPEERLKIGSEEKPAMKSENHPGIPAPETPPKSPPKTNQSISQSENSSPFIRSALSPMNSKRQLLTPPNLTPPVTRRPYFQKVGKTGKKLSFKVEQ